MDVKDLKWIVYRHSFNKDEIKTFNIFDHGSFREDVEKHLKKYKDKDEFAEYLKRSLLYYFWSKYEHEVTITSFPPRITMKELDRLNEERSSHKEAYSKDYVTMGVNLETENKIDIYNQVMNNWDIFLDYCWDSKIHRPRKKKTENI